MESQKCNLCNTTSKEMTALSCNHIICNDCFYKICLFNKKTIVSYIHETEKKIDVKCLICSSGILQISKKEILNKLNEKTIKIKKNYSVKCAWHSKEKNIFCIECKIEMCAECFLSHKSLQMFALHQQSENQLYSNSNENTCHLHDSLSLNYFCNDCDLTLCEMCKSVHDVEHKIGLVEDFINQMQEYKSKFKLIHSVEEIYDRLKETNKDLKEEIRREVSDLKDKMHSIIDNLVETCNQLDKEQEILFEEIDINIDINKKLFNNLNQDLENNFKSAEFNVNSKYLTKINITDSLTKGVLKKDILIKSINEMKNLLDIQNIEIKNKWILYIDDENDAFPLTQTLSDDVDDEGHLDNGDVEVHLDHTDHTDNAEHKETVSSTTGLSEGRINYGSVDKTAKLWDPREKFKCTNTLILHSESVYSLIQLEDGRIASGSKDKTIRVWDPFHNFKTTNTLTGHTNYVLCIIQLLDGRLASSSADKTIKIWNPQNNFKCAHTLTGHTSSINNIIQLQDGRLASGSGDTSIKIWNHQDNFKCVGTLIGHTSCVNSLIQFQDGSLASGSADKTIRIWSSQENFKCIHILNGHTSCVNTLIQLQDGTLASGSADKTIKIWNPQENFKCVKTLTGHSNYVVRLIQLQDERLASSSADSSIRIWNLQENFKCTHNLTQHKNSVTSLLQLKDCRIISGSSDTTIKIWESNEKK